jgi:hypothetical protein
MGGARLVVVAGRGVLSYGGTVRARRGQDDSEKSTRALVIAGSGSSEAMFSGCKAVPGAEGQAPAGRGMSALGAAATKGDLAYLGQRVADIDPRFEFHLFTRPGNRRLVPTVRQSNPPLLFKGTTTPLPSWE